jgi:hypothetical protein
VNWTTILESNLTVFHQVQNDIDGLIPLVENAVHENRDICTSCLLFPVLNLNNLSVHL